MKISASTRGFLIALILVLISFSVYKFLEKKDGYVIDNPSKELIDIRIDNENYKIGPQQQVRLQLAKGEHKIKFSYLNNSVDTTINIVKSNGLFNPTRAEYIIFTRPYGYRKNKDSIFTTQNLTIDKKVYFGKMSRTNKLYEENFYYNIDQDYPKLFLKSDKKTDLDKIFSKDGFKQFYFEYYE